MTTHRLLTLIILLIALLIGLFLKSVVPELLKVEAVQKHTITLAVR